MPENKTRPTKVSVASFLNAIESDVKRKDVRMIAKLFREISGKRPTMWGPTIIGYGSYHYRYESGREGDSPRIGFSPRAQSLVIYNLMPGFAAQDRLLSKLGKHKTGRSCLYINKLADIDFDVLETIARQAWDEMEKRCPQ